MKVSEVLLEVKIIAWWGQSVNSLETFLMSKYTNRNNLVGFQLVECALYEERHFLLMSIWEVI